MFEIGVSGQFEAAHQLHGDFGPATRFHGHTYRIDVIVRGERLGDDNALVDIGLLQTTLNDLIDRLHYRNLDEVEGLKGTNTTAEGVANFCWEAFAGEIRGLGLHTLLVRIWENPNIYAAREDPID